VAATASFSAGTAISTALGTYPGSTKGAVPELIIHARQDIPVLSYDVIVSRTAADGMPSQLHVIVDATTNRILDAWDDVQAAAATGTGKTLFVGTMSIPTDLTGSTYSLKDPTRGNQYVVDLNNTTPTSTTTVGGTLYTSTTNIWGTNANGTTVAGRQTLGADAGEPGKGPAAVRAHPQPAGFCAGLPARRRLPGAETDGRVYCAHRQGAGCGAVAAACARRERPRPLRGRARRARGG
jgi:hypothetical protein